MVPPPGRASPTASVRQLIEFAVNIPEHEPQVGQAEFSISASLLSLIFPAFSAPTASNTLFRLRPSPSSPQGSDSIAPPVTNMDGKFRRIAAISIPGTTLSQLGINTSPSKQCARTVHSMLSAIISRVHSEYFMPVCPMAMPSHTPMVLNSSGVPPADSTPSFTARASCGRCT